jgi:CDP-diacylglycerol--glycerol-3-phosphate 3-phosphatidyltransferase
LATAAVAGYRGAAGSRRTPTGGGWARRQGGIDFVFRIAARLYCDTLSEAAAAVGRTGVHPNTITALSLLPALAAGVAAAWGQFWVAAVLLLLSGVCDLLDGALARGSGKVSRFGALLDSSLDRISDAAVPAGLVLFYAPEGSVVLIPLLMIVAGYTVSYVRARAEGLDIDLPRLWMRREDRMAGMVVGLLVQPLRLSNSAGTADAMLVIIALLALMSFIAGGMALAAAARATAQG